MFPEMVRYFDLIGRMTRSGYAQVGPPTLHLVRGRLRFTELANTLFQGRAAAGGKDAGWALTEATHDPKSALFGSRVVAWIHDEILAEVPETKGHEAGHEIASIMIKAMSKVIPDVPITASPVLMKVWSKSAAPVWDGGRLVAWGSGA